MGYSGPVGTLGCWPGFLPNSLTPILPGEGTVLIGLGGACGGHTFGLWGTFWGLFPKRSFLFGVTKFLRLFRNRLPILTSSLINRGILLGPLGVREETVIFPPPIFINPNSPQRPFFGNGWWAKRSSGKVSSDFFYSGLGLLGV